MQKEENKIINKKEMLKRIINQLLFITKIFCKDICKN